MLNPWEQSCSCHNGFWISPLWQLVQKSAPSSGPSDFFPKSQTKISNGMNDHFWWALVAKRVHVTQSLQRDKSFCHHSKAFLSTNTWSPVPAHNLEIWSLLEQIQNCTPMCFEPACIHHFYWFALFSKPKSSDLIWLPLQSVQDHLTVVVTITWWFDIAGPYSTGAISH